MKIQRIILPVLLCILTLSTVDANPMFGRKELLLTGWRFKLSLPSDSITPKTQDLSGWREVTLPHDWSVEGPYSPDKASATGFLPGGIP